MAFGVPDVLMSPSRWLLDWHRAYGFWGKTEIVLSNPVALGEARERTRYRPSTVAYVGRLAGEKGFADVLEAIPKLDLATVGSVVLVGDGPLWKKISLLNDSRVEACGPVEPEEARAVIADADLLLAPSHLLENQPTVILEAMAEGTPVIATDVGGVQELLEGTGAGVLPIADNFGACLAKEAKAILDDAKRWEAVSLAVRARAAERHDPNRYLEALERLFV